MAFGDPDASTPAYVKANSATKAVTTASFTPPVGARLVAFVVHDTAGGNLTNTSQVTDSQGLTWTRIATHSKQDDGTGANNGHIAVSIATVVSSVAMTVTTTGTNTNNPAGLYLLVVTGVDATTPVDVVDEGHNVNALVSQALTVVTNGARGYIVASDWNLAANMTAGSGQTAVVADGVGAPDLRFYVGRQNAVSAPGSVTMSTASPSTGNQNNWIALALRPASGGGAVSADASLAVTASFGTAAVKDIGASATSLAITASVSASAAKDVPVQAALAITASASATAAPTRIAATSLPITATLATSAAVGTVASLAIVATAAAAATPTRPGGSSLAIVWACSTSASITRPGSAALVVVVTRSTSTASSWTTTAALALTVALSASAGVSGSTVRGAIDAREVASSIGVIDRAAGSASGATSRAGAITATTRAGVINGV